MWNKVILFLTLCTMISCPVMAEETPVVTTEEITATESSTTKETDTIGTNEEKTLDDTLNTIMNDDSDFMDSSNVFDSYLYSNQTYGTSFSDMFGKLTGTEISQEQLIDISAFGGALDTGQVNMQYEALSKTILGSVSSTDESGKSADAASLFSSTYGDLASQLSLKKATIPDNFDTDAMMKTASKSVKKAYKQTMNSNAYKSVKNQISIGSIFKKAQNGVSTPSVNSSDLASNSKLSSIVKNASSSAKSNIKNEYSSGKSVVSNKAATAKKNSEQNTSGKSYGTASDHKQKTPKSPGLPVGNGLKDVIDFVNGNLSEEDLISNLE